MGIFSSIFGKPIDKVSIEIRKNTELVKSYMENTHSEIITYGDFTFEYMYTTSELITKGGGYGSVIYIRIESNVHEFLPSLPDNFEPIQESIERHLRDFNNLPNNLSKEKTRWLYFNSGKIFHTA